MVATKTNERPGTRSQVRYVRMSASKARVVLDLIRGKHVGEASQILAFNERLASKVIMKCLRSAVANAEHNDDIPSDELYVSACYADEGPTLKRFRPRARGRAGRIHKQTCHITIIVSRYDTEVLDEMRRRAELRGERGSGGGSADASADRRRRVARSRAAEEPETDTETVDTPTDAETPSEDTPAATEVAESSTDAETPSEDTPAATEVAESGTDAETPSEDTPAATEVAESTTEPESMTEPQTVEATAATSSDEAPPGADGAATSSDEAPPGADEAADTGAAGTDEETN